MKTVFLSGSRRISRLNDAVRARLANMISNGLQIVVGDANGADKAMQSYLKDEGYQNVTVYCAGSDCRNNVGSWITKNIEVDPALKGRAFYTQKDKAMAQAADLGFVLWDGKSNGSITNAMELLRRDKTVVLFFAPEKAFFNLKTIDQLGEIVLRLDAQAYESVFKTNLKSLSRVSAQSEKSTLPIF
jgi:hypothetical protein